MNQSSDASESLKRKARDKFGDGDWYVTDRALQQSTPWQVAKLKATWFGDSPVADLCCGIGGDTMWLARRGQTVAVDHDRSLVTMAESNCRLAIGDTKSAEFVCGDAIRFASGWTLGLHIDPDRRTGVKRTSTPDYYQPAWTDVAEMIERAPASVVKLAPAAIVDTGRVTRPTHQAWISLRGSVREQSLVVGDALGTANLPPHARSAIAVRGDASHSLFVSADFLTRAPIITKPGRWIVDPDASIRAAGLTDAFAIQNGMSVIGSPSGFLTSDIDTRMPPMAVMGQVEWFGSSDERKLRKEMRSRNVHAAVVKIRGVDREPEKLIRTLRDCGERPVTLWMGRVGKKVYAAWTTSP